MTGATGGEELRKIARGVRALAEAWTPPGSGGRIAGIKLADDLEALASSPSGGIEEGARGEGTEWFWRIVDHGGLGNVPSDEIAALNLLCHKAARYDEMVSGAPALPSGAREPSPPVSVLPGVAPSRGWQPIETAPGASNPSIRILIIGGAWDTPTITGADGEWWRRRRREGSVSVPTHWMPLPDPPVALWIPTVPPETAPLGPQAVSPAPVSDGRGGASGDQDAPPSGSGSCLAATSDAVALRAAIPSAGPHEVLRWADQYLEGDGRPTRESFRCVRDALREALS